MARDESTPLTVKAPPATSVRRYTAAYLAELETVFSGGYYIVLMEGEARPDQQVKTKAQQTRNKKQEEILRQSNMARSQTALEHHDRKHRLEDSDVKAPSTRHEKLIEELQSLVGRSDTVRVEHHAHMKNELSIARSQLLKNGGVDDYDLMRTISELASVQGLSMGGSVLAGRFVSDIIDAPEPRACEIPITAPTAEPSMAQEPAIASGHENDREAYQMEFPQFSAYNIAQIGGYRHKSSYFFAKRLMTLLAGLSEIALPEPGSAEIAR